MLKISVDGGALSSKNKFGAQIVSTELVRVLPEYDTTNRYTIYTLNNSLPPQPRVSIRPLYPTLSWMNLAVTNAELFARSDIFLALNQAIPLYTHGRIISFSHGLSFMKYPHLYPDSVHKMRKQVEVMLKRSATIVVSSQKVVNDFKELYGKQTNIVSIPFGIPHAFLSPTHRFKKKKIIVYVGMSHPIKNIPFLITSFLKFVSEPRYKNYKLVLIGDHPRYQYPNIISIGPCTQTELLKYYNEAECVISASLYESFNLPILEALSQQTQVVATNSALIPELAPYVHTAPDTINGFASTMMKALEKPKKISLKQLQSQFNWYSYSKKLVSLYSHD